MATHTVPTTTPSSVNGSRSVRVDSQRRALLDASAAWEIVRAVAAVPTVAAAAAVLAAAVAGQLLAHRVGHRRDESLGEQGLL